MYNYLWMFFISLLISFLLTPVLVFLALRNEVVDEPGERKIHLHIKPLMGGFSVYFSIFISVLFFYGFSMHLMAMLMSTTLIVAIGMVDDFLNMRPLIKLFGQIGAAVILVFLSLPSFEPALVFLDNFLGLRIISYVVVIIWIVGVTNAFNLIDGLDGLATGTAIITGLFLALLSMIHGNHWAMGISLIILGACMGFYPHNFQPARIFLGDTGSMLLGFSLSAVFLFNIQYNVSFTVLAGGLLFFSYPLVDMVYAIYRRIKNKMPVFRADRQHIHHQLLDAGFSVRQAVFIIYAASFILGSFGIVIISFSSWQARLGIAVLIVIVTIVLLIGRRRHYNFLQQIIVPEKKPDNKN